MKTITVTCAKCQTPCIKDIRQYNRNLKMGSNNFYCSKICQNTARTKRLEVTCLTCNNLFTKMMREIKKSSKHYCSNSCAAKGTNKTRILPLGPLIYTGDTHIAIRQRAKVIISRSKAERICFICRYNKAVDVAHIKPVKDFKVGTSSEVINHISNLIYLCKNHHWEFDNNLMDEQDRNKILVREVGIEPTM